MEELTIINKPELTESPDAVVDPAAENLFLFDKIKSRLNKLKSEWAAEIEDTKARRQLRYIDIDIDQMRGSNEIAPDETFIPDRVIDTNIQREIPSYSAYLTGSRRLAIFRSQDVPEQETQRLEIEFTKGLMYNNWYKPFMQEVDGFLLHGWDAIEVMFDQTKPLHVSFEHIGHDRLIFTKDVASIQDSEIVLRCYDVTALQLEKFVSNFGFDAAQVGKILNKQTSNRVEYDKIYSIYKLYFKYQRVVWVAWFDLTSTSDWLKAPEKLRLGIYDKISAPEALLQGGSDINYSALSGAEAFEWKESDITMYPIFPHVYKETEECEITAKVGRAFLDEFRQEAHTCILTAFVNGTMRASNYFASPETPDEEEASLRQLDLTLEPCKVFSKKLNFWSQPYPDPSVLQALQFLGVTNAAQTGQVDFAVMNRKDSRKTAREVAESEQAAQELKTSPLTYYSEHLREIFSFAWKIVQSQALQGKVKLLLTPEVLNVAGTQIATGNFINNTAVIEQQYDIRTAADEDVIKRKEKIQNMMQDWPVVQTTPLARDFLADLMRLKYPEVGERYAQTLMREDTGKTLVSGLAAALQSMIPPDLLKTMPAQQQQQYAQLQQKVQQYLTTPVP